MARLKKESTNYQVAVILVVMVSVIAIGTLTVGSYYTGLATETYSSNVDSVKSFYGQHGYRNFEGNIVSVDLYAPGGGSLKHKNVRALELSTDSPLNGIRLTQTSCKNLKNRFEDTKALYFYTNDAKNLEVYYKDYRLNKNILCNVFTKDAKNFVSFLPYLDISLSILDLKPDVEISSGRPNKYLGFWLTVDGKFDDAKFFIKSDPTLCYGEICYLGWRRRSAVPSDIVIRMGGYYTLPIERNLGNVKHDHITQEGVRVYRPSEFGASDRFAFGIPVDFDEINKLPRTGSSGGYTPRNI